MCSMRAPGPYRGLSSVQSVALRDRRETRGTNWRVREAVGIRAPRPRPDYGREVVERLEEQLRQFAADKEDEAAN